MSRTFLARAYYGLVLLIAATCVAVQYNDPDGAWWMLAYSFAGVIALLGVLEVYTGLTVLVILGYLIGAAVVMPWADLNSQLFGMPEWHMGPESNEPAREAGGLLVCGLLLLPLALAWWRERNAGTGGDTEA